MGIPKSVSPSYLDALRALAYHTGALLCVLACSCGPNTSATRTSSVPIRYWDLSTGSHIAYAHVPAARKGPLAAVVFVHGGPGAYQVAGYDIGKEWYAHLAQLGFDIYVYDQVGSGHSGRLVDPTEYSLARHLADLDAIRELIGSPRLILIGDSWGATLVAHFMSTRPGAVAKAVFTSPGAIDPGDWSNQSPSPQLDNEMLQWLVRTRGREGVQRYFELNRLLERDIRTAHRFAPDEEMDLLFSAFVSAEVLKRAVANTAKLRDADLEMHGMGWWAHVITSFDAVNRTERARPRLVTCDVPVLILRGDADYLPKEIAEEYGHTFPRARLVRVPDAGHFIWLDNPAVYGKEIESFLLGSL